MKRLLVNIALFILALVLLSTAGLFGLVYGLYYSIRHFNKRELLKYWVELIYSINLGIDQIGNVLLGTFLNKFCLINTGTKNKFGKVRETISYVLAVNYFSLNLTSFGKKIVFILDYLDKDHMAKSLNRDP